MGFFPSMAAGIPSKIALGLVDVHNCSKQGYRRMYFTIIPGGLPLAFMLPGSTEAGKEEVKNLQHTQNQQHVGKQNTCDYPEAFRMVAVEAEWRQRHCHYEAACGAAAGRPARA